ncbi:discoidin domain-containing protein [Dickeya chrysanthemi]|uniref:discoidin domain-containing protein n=1 Tax=Dickeya chrysanthemi TaxID=556 RepID=UPI00067D84BB|nr:discoidin domain-containing protein [Dickeya chrysanthemi]
MADEITIPPVESLPSITEADEFSDVKLLPYGIRARGYDGQAIGPANYQAQALANRTHYLKTRLDSIGTPIKSVFGRTTQSITAQTGDYTADQITETAGKRFVSPADVQAWNAKLSASSVSTLNGKSLMGGGNVTLSDIGAAPVVHQHTASEVTGLFPAIYSALVPGDGIAITSDSSGRSVIAATAASGGGGSGSQFTVVTKNITSLSSPSTFYLSDQTSFAYAAYALKEEAGSTVTVTADTYDSGDGYNHSPFITYNGIARIFNGGDQSLSLSNGLYTTADLPIGIRDIYVSQIQYPIPSLTSATSAAGIALNQSSQLAGYETWKAFDGASGTFWNAASGAALPQWISVSFSTQTPISGYSLTAIYDGKYSPSAWQLQGSNDGNTWTTIESKSGETFTANQEKIYSLTATAIYQSYRLYITASPGGVGVVGEFNLINNAQRFLLLADDGNYYTASSGSLSAVPAPLSIADITATGFSSSGKLTQSNKSIVKILSNFGGKCRAFMRPSPQISIPKAVVNVRQYTSMTSAAVTAAQVGGGSVRLAVSKNLTEWFVFSASTWVSIGTLTANDADASKLMAQGMTPAMLAGITASQWAAFYTDTLGMPDSIAFAFAMDIQNPETDAASIDTASITVAASAWKVQSSTEVEIRWYRDRVTFKPATTGNYKFAYQQPQ